MSFGPNHYVPVLKVKQNEKRALRLVAESLKERITPLLEIVERKHDKTPTLKKHLDTAFDDLAECVAGYARCFLDTREIAAEGASAAARVFERADADGVSFIPVTGISRSADLAAVLDYRANGIAVRLTRKDFEAGNLALRTGRFMQDQGLGCDEVDMIVDLGAVDDLITEGVAALTEAFLGEVPNQREWRTFSVVGSAFPSSMGCVERNSHKYVERAEWLAWRDHLHAHRSLLERLPTFGDCAIQHPKGVEGFDPQIMQASAAIRYKTADNWLIIKGQGTKHLNPSSQFPQLAATLVYGQLKQAFAGSTHCEGCLGAKSAADGAAKLGSPGKWRLLGTVHHLTAVVEDLLNLPWP